MGEAVVVVLGAVLVEVEIVSEMETAVADRVRVERVVGFETCVCDVGIVEVYPTDVGSAIAELAKLGVEGSGNVETLAETAAIALLGVGAADVETTAVEVVSEEWIASTSD